MTVEYVLLIFMFVLTLFGSMIKMPKEAFYSSGPSLGARIERLISTGDKFVTNGSALKWSKPSTDR
jgi:hypothetical protein